MKIWRAILEPPSTDYTWLRLNQYSEVTGTFKYKDGKWVVDKNKTSNNGSADISESITKELSEESTDEQVVGAKTMYDIITDNEEVTAAALNDLNSRLTAVEELMNDN